MMRFILLFFSSFALSALYSASYYVAPGGNDHNSGQISSPFASIQKGADTLKAGDTLFIRDGVYKISTDIRIHCNGMRSKWIVICPYPGEKPEIDATDYVDIPKLDSRNNIENTGAITINHASYVKLLKLRIRNSHNFGIFMEHENTHHIEISGCIIDHTFNAAIGDWGADTVKIINCEIRRANDPEMHIPSVKLMPVAPNDALSLSDVSQFEIAYTVICDSKNAGISFKEACAGGLIHHNTVFDAGGSGIDINSLYGVTENIEVWNNEIYSCGWGISISAEGEGAGMRNVKVNNNIIYKNKGSGIIFNTNGNNCRRMGIYVFCNTVCKNGSYGHAAGNTGGIDLRTNNLSDVYVVNNISWENYAFDIATFNNPMKGVSKLKNFNILVEHNLTGETKSVEQPKGSSNKVYQYLGEDAIVADPMFADPANADYSLLPKSPALGTAKRDYPFETGEDIGALGKK